MSHIDDSKQSAHFDKPVTHSDTLKQNVIKALDHYFSQVEPEQVSKLYQLVLAEVEAPLLETVMKQARSNQSKAAVMLGLNRGTLRTKLKQYNML